MASKGQNAVEYMMTYGWALLIILVMGIVVWQMGFLKISGNISPDKSGFSQITPLDWAMNETGGFTVIIQNNAGTIVTLDLGGTSANILSNGNGDCGGALFYPADLTMRPADTRKLYFTSCSLDDPHTGEYYRVNLTIRYQNYASQLTHKSNGLIWGPVG